MAQTSISARPRFKHTIGSRLSNHTQNPSTLQQSDPALLCSFVCSDPHNCFHTVSFPLILSSEWFFLSLFFFFFFSSSCSPFSLEVFFLFYFYFLVNRISIQFQVSCSLVCFYFRIKKVCFFWYPSQVATCLSY